MCELLIRTVDKDPTDRTNPLKSQRGDVIAVVDDGHPWSEAERTAPYWTIIKLPGVPKSEFEPLTGPDVGVDGVLRARRSVHINLDNASIAGRATATREQLQTAVRTRVR